VSAYLYGAEPCDETDLDYGVRLLKGASLIGRLSADEAIVLARALVASARESETRRFDDADRSLTAIEADIKRDRGESC
jgi:hypothetical protein